SFDDLGAHSQNGGLAGGPHPEMTVLHQEIDTMFFERDRKGIVFRNTLDDFHIRDVQLIPAGSALVGTNFAFDDDTRLLGKALNSVEDLGRNCTFRNDPLDGPAAIAKDGEQKFSALAQVVEPSADGYDFTFVAADFSDGGDWGGHRTKLTE